MSRWANSSSESAAMILVWTLACLGYGVMSVTVVLHKCSGMFTTEAHTVI